MRRNVLLNFSNAFNTAMRVNIINDGRFIGLVELDALLNAGVSDPARYGLTNVTNAGVRGGTARLRHQHAGAPTAMPPPGCGPATCGWVRPRT